MVTLAVCVFLACLVFAYVQTVHTKAKLRYENWNAMSHSIYYYHRVSQDPIMDILLKGRVEVIEKHRKDVDEFSKMVENSHTQIFIHFWYQNILPIYTDLFFFYGRKYDLSCGTDKETGNYKMSLIPKKKDSLNV